MSHPRIKYAGGTHVALRYIQMKRGKVATVSDVLKMFPNKFDKPSRAKEALEILAKNQLISAKNSGWVITTHGSDYLRATSSAYKGG
jgi:hypothetical protein